MDFTHNEARKQLVDRYHPGPPFSNKKKGIIVMDFFANHSVLVLVCLMIFPRLTLLLAGFATGGCLWWLGWVFTPYLLVAFLSLPYYDTNPCLVIGAWILAFSGTYGESRVATRNRKR